MRHLMGIVAIAGVLLAGVSNLMQRSRHLERLALDHLKERNSILLSDIETYLILTPSPFGIRPREAEEPQAIFESRVAAYIEREKKMRSDFDPLIESIRCHYRLSEQYERAAAHPWYPAAPDAPESPKLSLSLQKSLRARYSDLLQTTQPESESAIPISLPGRRRKAIAL